MKLYSFEEYKQLNEVFVDKKGYDEYGTIAKTKYGKDSTSFSDRSKIRWSGKNKFNYKDVAQMAIQGAAFAVPFGGVIAGINALTFLYRMSVRDARISKIAQRLKEVESEAERKELLKDLEQLKLKQLKDDKVIAELKTKAKTEVKKMSREKIEKNKQKFVEKAKDLKNSVSKK